MDQQQQQPGLTPDQQETDQSRLGLGLSSSSDTPYRTPPYHQFLSPSPHSSPAGPRGPSPQRGGFHNKRHRTPSFENPYSNPPGHSPNRGGYHGYNNEFKSPGPPFTHQRNFQSPYGARGRGGPGGMMQKSFSSPPFGQQTPPYSHRGNYRGRRDSFGRGGFRNQPGGGAGCSDISRYYKASMLVDPWKDLIPAPVLESEKNKITT
ncbi:uncharacterized protein LOC141912367 [Tubulanus polymorphus]|uniref:uncharacterized protein LOC141912367 n=1 Tax=Tubulanus polymorphus TaxID=672921 RepID=UPI003DA23ADC